jgi:hypothetical protein
MEKTRKQILPWSLLKGTHFCYFGLLNFRTIRQIYFKPHHFWEFVVGAIGN